MASTSTRRKVGLGLLGSGVVGEAIQDIIFEDRRGKLGEDLELEIRRIYTRSPEHKKWFSKRSALFATKADALKEAQQKGYAETNPASDVSGSDAEAKLLLLNAVAFGLQLEPGTTWRKGIEDIHAVDFRYAGRTGSSTIKHFAVAKRQGQVVQVFVSPVMLPRENFLAGIDGATNAICFKGKKSGGARRDRDCDYVLVGPGA